MVDVCSTAGCDLSAGFRRLCTALPGVVVVTRYSDSVNIYVLQNPAAGSDTIYERWVIAVILYNER